MHTLLTYTLGFTTNTPLTKALLTAMPWRMSLRGIHNRGRSRAGTHARAGQARAPMHPGGMARAAAARHAWWQSCTHSPLICNLDLGASQCCILARRHGKLLGSAIQHVKLEDVGDGGHCGDLASTEVDLGCNKSCVVWRKYCAVKALVDGGRQTRVCNGLAEVVKCGATVTAERSKAGVVAVCVGGAVSRGKQSLHGWLMMQLSGTLRGPCTMMSRPCWSRSGRQTAQSS
jgi:hypothetical protein